MVGLFSLSFFIVWNGGDVSGCFLFLCLWPTPCDSGLVGSVLCPFASHEPLSRNMRRAWRDGEQLGSVFFSLGLLYSFLSFFLVVDLCCWTGMR